ncbi:MAG: class I SAM-dependent RNA methyltransferase [Humidesulfovibrio sp.]|uniref:THUMP domain-containing class I SAM-dependent RNA methyltransferase n=1 Tax=Humidesulfovibrio sp. TaxID=2910988 RepID=UPI0027EB1D05|nr:class I SAM-dependent RNA methyltransferase [Humidesulfovibrio sp.]MDQ7834706.1 class I SAM-dependent RNA methyltransferase [Humidesulfovibrio sp.]
MTITAGQRPILVTCPKALPPFLRAELEALGLPARELTAAVETRGDMHTCMRLNLSLRTGHRVLYELERFRADDPTALGRELFRLPWEDIIPVDGHLTVDSSVQNDFVTDGRFANQKAKDAIVDRIQEQEGRRPNSGPDPVGACVFLHWRGSDVTVYLDTTGYPLPRRGYRKMPHKAPLQESLAAGIILATRFDAQTEHFLSPMCGSGTLAIEAALLGLGRAPGLLRPDFAFRHLIDFDEAAYDALRRELHAQAKKTLPCRILASDNDPQAVEAARQNARTAGVEDHIEFSVADFRETEVPEGPGVCVLNPEYGERLGDIAQLAETYAAIGDFFKQRLPGWRGYVFTGNAELAKRVGLKPKRRIPFYNAKIECRLLEFELYQGSRRPPREG